MAESPYFLLENPRRKHKAGKRRRRRRSNPAANPVANPRRRRRSGGRRRRSGGRRRNPRLFGGMFGGGNFGALFKEAFGIFGGLFGTELLSRALVKYTPLGKVPQPGAASRLALGLLAGTIGRRFLGGWGKTLGAVALGEAMHYYTLPMRTTLLRSANLLGLGDFVTEEEMMAGLGQTGRDYGLLGLSDWETVSTMGDDYEGSKIYDN